MKECAFKVDISLDALKCTNITNMQKRKDFHKKMITAKL